MKLGFLAIVLMALAACAEARFSPVGDNGVTRAAALPKCDAAAAAKYPFKGNRPAFWAWDYDARIQRIRFARTCMEAQGFVSR